MSPGRPHPFVVRAQNESDFLHREQDGGPWQLLPNGVVVRVVATFERNDTWYAVERRNRNGVFVMVGKPTQDAQKVAHEAQAHATASGLLHRMVEYVLPPRQETTHDE